ncbi:MAG TPA: DUF4352 domain-containing protein [Thermomicrobiales bacterium]|nr:DUF4352 domain-containing protein [Thermomicrobiales bacterium]
MRRIYALAALVALTLSLLAPSLTSAQTGTPATGSTGSFGVPVGTAVPYIGSDGAEVGTITVNSVTDQFEGFDQSSAPQRGYHYGIADITITNTSNRPFEVDPGSFMAVDSDGFIAQQPYITFTDPSITALEYSDALAPGDSATGAVAYSLFGDSTIQGILYSPTYDRIVTVLDLRTQPVAVGTPVSILNTSGAEAAQVTVDSIAAPFEGYDASSAPPRGSSYVAVEVTVTNTGSGVLSVSPSDFWVIDADGFVLSSSYVGRTDTTVPDYDYLDLNPGDSQHGMLIYQIYEGVPIDKIAYGDGYTSIQVVADVDASSTTASAPAIGAAVPAATATVGLAEATVESGSTTASTSDCEGLVEWGLDLVDRIGRAADLTAPFQTQDASTLDAATVRDVAGQLRAMGDEQAASNPPAAAAELNTIMTEQFYYALADAVDTIANALEQNNAASALAGQMAAQAVTKVFDEGGVYDIATEALTTACPNEVNQLDAQAGS